MKIVAVSTVWNEADIVGTTFAHLRDEGVDDIYVALRPSQDDTAAILAGLECRVWEDRDEYHMQRQWATALAERAYEDGADWVLAVDADEFWYSPQGKIREVLAAQPDDVGVLVARMFQHHDVEYRELEPKPLGKVAFRARPGVIVADGNHNVANVPGRVEWGVLNLRELQFRSFEHFCRKVKERNLTLDPAHPPEARAGAHMTQFARMSVEQLRDEWEQIRSVRTVYDPIPSLRCFSTTP